MKYITLNVRATTFKSAEEGVNWSPKMRILIRTSSGIHIGTVKSVDKDSDVLEIMLDNKVYHHVNRNSTVVLGEGINRKRSSTIPDDELYMWKRELRADIIKSINNIRSV